MRYSIFSAKQTTVPVRARRILRHAAEHQVHTGSQPLRQLRYATVARGRSQKIQVIPVDFPARLPYNFSTTSTDRGVDMNVDKTKNIRVGFSVTVGGLRIRFVRRAAFNGEGGGQKGLDLIGGVLDLISSGVTTIRTIFIVFFFAILKI